MTLEELEKRFLRLEAILEQGTLQIENPEDRASVIVHQRGVSTAVVVENETDNPCVKLVAKGNAAALEIMQLDGEDACVTNGDIRCRAICPEIVALPLEGSIGIARLGEPNKSDEFFFPIVDNEDGKRKVVLGNPQAQIGILMRSANYIDFEVAGVLWRLSQEGFKRI